MMVIIAKTQLYLTLKEFWLMTPKEFFSVLNAWIKFNIPGDKNELPPGQRRQGKDIVYDVLPAGMSVL
jgi:hypothetical protein